MTHSQLKKFVMDKKTDGQLNKNVMNIFSHGAQNVSAFILLPIAFIL